MYCIFNRKFQYHLNYKWCYSSQTDCTVLITTFFSTIVKSSASSEIPPRIKCLHEWH